MKKFTNPRARFSGELKGIKVEQLKGIDFRATTLEERLKMINEKINEIEPFLNEYFFSKEGVDEEGNKQREYFKYNPNSKDELSEDINICKYIQSYASYLLNSDDIEKEKMSDYTILTEEEFKKQLSKEMSTDFKIDSSIVLDTRPTNDYKNLDLKITKKDMYPHTQNNKYGVRDKDLELARILNDYETLREHLRAEMSKIKNGEQSYLTLYQIKSLLSSIIGDMHDSKRMILDLKAPAKRLGDESPYNDFSELDYKNTEHIKQCLKFCKITNTPRPDDMVSHIGYDLNVALNKLYKEKRIDYIDKEVIDCYNSGNYTIREIANEIKKDSKTVQQRLDKVCRRIAEVI